MIVDVIKNKQNNLSFIEYFKKNNAGIVNKVIQYKFNPYVPIIDVIRKISNWFDKLYTIKFQGKPVSIDPLINSTIPKIKEKRKNEPKFVFGFKTTNKYATKA